jgi:predicted lipoprotein with Yx(FWY)xxD motif
MAGAALLVAACGSRSSGSHSSAAAPASNTSVGTVAIGTAKGLGATYLTGASGRSVYLWVADTSDKSNCASACVKAWPPVLTKSAPTASAGVQASDLGTITRSNGAKQVTYKGHPLYYYVGDSHSGTWTGQGSNSFGAKWWLVNASGSPITSTASAKSGSSSSSSSGGKVGY